MNHSLFTGKNFNKGSDRNDASNGARKHLALIHLAGEAFDDLLSFLSRCTVMGSNGDNATVLNIDLGVGALRDVLDGASTRSDHRANQLRINAETQQARCMRRQPFTRTLDRFHHLFKDV